MSILKIYKKFENTILKLVFKYDFYSLFIPFYFITFFNINKYTLIALIITVVFVVYRKTGSVIISLWTGSLAMLPFNRGFDWSFLFVPKYEWGGNKDLIYFYSLTFSQILLFLTLIITLRNPQKEKFNFKDIIFKNKFYLIILSIFILNLFMPISYAPDKVVFLLSILGFVFPILYFVTGVLLRNVKNWLKVTKQVLVSVVIFQGTWAILQQFKNGPLGRGLEEASSATLFGVLASENPGLFRSSGTFHHPNFLASFLIILLPISIYLLFSKNQKKSIKIISVLATVSAVFGILLSFSRAVWILLFIFTGALGYTNYSKIKGNFKKVYPILLPGLLLAVLIFSIASPRLSTIKFALQEGETAHSRLVEIENSFILAKNYPLGAGFGMSPLYLKQIAKSQQLVPISPHSFLAQLLSETGVIGLISFSTFLFLALKPTFKKLKRIPHHKLPFVIGVVLFLVLANIYHLIMSPNISGYFWLFLAIIV